MYATFDDSLITGNEMIDEQHKELIDKINKLLKSCEESSGQLSAIKMLEYLADYTEFHLGEEENLQEEIDYPGLEAHKQKHEELRQTVQDLHLMLQEQEGPSEEFVKKVEEKVINWLYYHIKTFDRSIAEFIFMREQPERL